MKFFKTLFKNRKQFNFINLTTGLGQLIEWKNLRFDGFTRLQSTYLEQKLFGMFLRELDNNILMHLALGHIVCIFDMTSRHNHVSRVCWQGIPWIVYSLERTWFNRENEFSKGMHVYFAKEYEKLPKSILKRMKYYRKFLKTDKVNLGYICNHTDHDGDFEYYKKLVEKFL